MQTKWTTLPSDVALQCPPWASDATKAIAAEVAEQFAITKRARAESDRLRDAVGDVDPMTTSVSDLTGAAATARQSQLECLRTEIIARARFGEYLDSLESDRRQTEREALGRIEAARNEAKAALLDAGCHDLSVAVNHRGKADETLRIAFNQVLNSGFPAVGKAADTYREARSMATALTERGQYNRRHREEAESALRSMLSALATAAVG